VIRLPANNVLRDKIGYLLNALRGHLAELGIVRARGHSGVKAAIEALHAFQLAEVAVSRQIFADVLSLIARLRAPPASA
jgi:hypothetical protein